jgi:plastocyanin
MKRNLLTLALALVTVMAQAGDLQVSVIDKEGKPVQDAVVVLMPSTRATSKAALPTQIVINQEKMRFSPAVSLIATGGKARFVNNDPWEHHVRASAAGAGQFNTSDEGLELRLDGKAEGKPAKTADVTFDKAGAVLLGCHLHSSMRGHVYVSDSPWAAITNADGVVKIDDVPNGAVQVRVWHADQLIDIPVQQLTLTATPAEAKAQLNVVPRRRRI